MTRGGTHLLARFGQPLFLSSRSEDSKEVFLAIQVDGVTRARTAPLALRGPALSLNHAFHLELERAQLLRLILLTPGEAARWDQKRSSAHFLPNFGSIFPFPTATCVELCVLSCVQRTHTESRSRADQSGTECAVWAESQCRHSSKVPHAPLQRHRLPRAREITSFVCQPPAASSCA